MTPPFAPSNASTANMSAGTLASLARLLPGHRPAWRGALQGVRHLRPPHSRASRCISCSAAQLDPASSLTDLQQDPSKAQHGVYGDLQAAASAAAAAGTASASSSSSDGGGNTAGGEGAGGSGGRGGAARTGAFQRIPMVSPAKELLESALRRAARVGANKKLKNEAQKAKNRAARQLDTLLKELCVPLGKYVKEFPPPARLHPFEMALLELTVGPGTYERVLGRVDALRRSTVQVGKAYAARCSKALNKKEAIELQEEGFERVEAVFAKGAAAVDELKEVAKTLRKLPVVDPQLPTVALVGAPNVGKSSLVQLLSSGLPEVQNYPFTTRSIKMGHFYVDGRRHQVTDTPGLLNRPDADRNAMERLTLASLQHLPTAVLFVADLTGECGTSVANQWRIREDLKAKFPGKPWIDVLSKADMLEEEFDAADELAEQQPQHAEQAGQAAAGAGPGASSAGGGAVGQQQHLGESGTAASEAPLLERSSNGNGSSDSGSSSPAASSAAGPAVPNAVEFAAALPYALRVSSLTGDGIERLKASMMAMLEEAQLERAGLEGWWAEAEGDQAEEAGEGLDELIFHDDEEHREHDAYMYD